MTVKSRGDLRGGSAGARHHMPEGRTPMDIGRNLKRWRLLRGYTQDDVAILAGCCSSAVSYIERGRACPKPGTVTRLAEALGITPATLWD